MFYASSLCEICASSYDINSGLPSLGLPGLPGGKSLFFASPKERKQRKGDPQSGPLCGSLKKWEKPENLETSRLCRRRTSRFFNPASPTFSSPARTGGGGESGTGLGSGSQSPHPSPLPGGEGTGCVAHSQISFLSPIFLPLPLGEGRGEGSPNPRWTPLPQPVLAGLEIFSRNGLKNLDARGLRSRLVSRFSVSAEYFKEPRSGPDCGSPFLCLRSFGEAKESELQPGNPGTPSKANQNQPTTKLREN